MNEVENDFSKKKLGFKDRLPSGSIQKGLYRRMWVQQETILFLKAMKYTKRFFGLNYIFASLILHLSIIPVGDGAG